MKGRIRFFSEDRGYGFIEPDDQGADIFVHISQIVAGGKPDKNERCIFDVADNPRNGRPMATNVFLGG